MILTDVNDVVTLSFDNIEEWRTFVDCNNYFTSRLERVVEITFNFVVKNGPQYYLRNCMFPQLAKLDKVTQHVRRPRPDEREYIMFLMMIHERSFLGHHLSDIMTNEVAKKELTMFFYKFFKQDAITLTQHSLMQSKFTLFEYKDDLYIKALVFAAKQFFHCESSKVLYPTMWKILKRK